MNETVSLSRLQQTSHTYEVDGVVTVVGAVGVIVEGVVDVVGVTVGVMVDGVVGDVGCVV